MADRTEKEKKRKRREDESSKSSKRVAIEGDNQVKISLQKADRWAPVIGTQHPQAGQSNLLSAVLNCPIINF
jgi:hypothetical protein